VYENEPVDTYVTSVNFNGLMTVYTIIEDTECADHFQINPFTGVISTKVIEYKHLSTSSLYHISLSHDDEYPHFWVASNSRTNGDN
jgi:hypothetical protein